MAPIQKSHQRHSSIRTQRITVVLALVVAIIYKIYIHDILTITLGIGRVIQPIEDFPYECQRIEHPLLEGCEDMWLDHRGRKLYAACSSVKTRLGWCPGGNKYNLSSRERTDHISVLNIDHPGPDSLFGLHQLTIGGNFSADLDLHGLDARYIGDRLRFWLINHRPPIDDKSGNFLDSTKVGANTTIEIFDLDQKSSKLEYVKTIHDDALVSPNNLAVDDDGVGFLVTNDHDIKVSVFRDLTQIIGGGSTTYCRTDTGKCNFAARKGFYLPNGVVKGHDGLFYIAHSAKGKVTAHKMTRDGLVQTNEVRLHVPLDNLSVDANGNIIAAAFPDALKSVEAMGNPKEATAPATAIMIRKSVPQAQGNEEEVYETFKLAEDRDAKFLPTSTVAINDVVSERLFFGGVSSPYIAVCKKR